MHTPSLRGANGSGPMTGCADDAIHYSREKILDCFACDDDRKLQVTLTSTAPNPGISNL